MIWLKEQGYQVLGVEISDIAVSEFFTENNLSFSKKTQAEFEVYESDSIQIYRGDFFKLTTTDLQDVQAVFDRASLIALPQDMRRDYVTKLRQCLPKSAPILLISLEYFQEEMDGPPFSVKIHEINQLYHGQYGIECCSEVDALAENPQFRQRGLSELLEMVYLLRPKA
jgi:thiopurine S-methyltransferase